MTPPPPPPADVGAPQPAAAAMERLLAWQPPQVSMGALPSTAWMAKMYARFRLFSILFALLQMAVLALNVGGRLTKSGGLFVALGFFMLLLNVGVVGVASWTSLELPMKRGLVLVSGMAAIAFLLWIVSDWTASDSTGVAAIVLVLTAACWVGVLMISGRLIKAAGAAEDVAGAGKGGAAGVADAKEDSCGQCILKMLRAVHPEGAAPRPRLV